MLLVHKSVFSALNYLSREEKAPLYGDAVAAYQDKGEKVSFPFKQKQYKSINVTIELEPINE